jgi:hypothetical protein
MSTPMTVPEPTRTSPDPPRARRARETLTRKE